MKGKWLFVVAVLAGGGSAPAFAGCSMEFEVCSAWCGARHIGSEARKMGCKTRCLAERAACLAEVGVEKAKKTGKEGAEKAEGFWEGFWGED